MRSLALVVLMVYLAAPADAQIAMPDASQLSGVPLPAPELPTGTITVRVVRERMGNNISGQTVTLKAGGASEDGTSPMRRAACSSTTSRPAPQSLPKPTSRASC